MKTTTINPNTVTLVKVPLSMDLLSIFRNGDTKNVINFAKNMTDYGNGTPSNVKVKFTPYITTKSDDNKGVQLPAIVLNKTFQ